MRRKGRFVGSGPIFVGWTIWAKLVTFEIQKEGKRKNGGELCSSI